MIDINQIYPYFEKGCRLVLEPVGGLLDFPFNETRFRKGQKLELNPLAVEIVKRCTGGSTCSEIVSEIGHNFKGAGFDVHDSAAVFIANLGSRNLIRFSDMPGNQPLKIVGSTDYFTPLHFSIELTDYCNLCCRHCYRQSSPQQKNFLPAGKLLSLLDIMEKQGVSSLELTGGEPMAHPEFTGIFEKASWLFDRVGVVSNGTLINDEIIKAFSKSNKLIIVQIDLDGDSPEIHDNLRGIPGSYEKVINSAKRMKDNGIKFRVVMNVHPGNILRVRQTADMALKLGARQFAFATVLSVGRAVKMPRLTEAEVIEFINLVNELEAAYPDFIQVSSREEEGQYLHRKGNCGGGSRSLVLGPTGNARPCAMLGEEYGHYGNLLYEDYLTVIKRAPLSEHYYLDMPGEELCTGCDYLNFCKGCFTRPFHARENAIRNKKDFVCAWNKKTKYIDMMEKFALLN